MGSLCQFESREDLDVPAQSDADGTGATQVRARVCFLAGKWELGKPLWTKPDLNNWCVQLPWLPLPPLLKFDTKNLFNCFEKKVNEKYKRDFMGKF